jgi:cob(I)alamin adenosyltransferase
MVRITKVYTKTGDGGSTYLAGGQQVRKTSLRIEAYGSVDELNAQLGMVSESLNKTPQLRNLQKGIIRIQNELFDLGSQLAVLPEDRRENTPVIKPADIEKLEREIDEMNAQLPILESFILPGGGEISARLHVARTVCRRVEREIIRLSEVEPLDGTEMPYLNRLGDWLFVASRYAAYKSDITETLWKPGKRDL